MDDLRMTLESFKPSIQFKVFYAVISLAFFKFLNELVLDSCVVGSRGLTLIEEPL